MPGTSSVLILFLSLPDPEHSRLARLFLILAYLIAAWLWWRAGARTVMIADSFLWRLGAALLFVLAVNRLFNLRPLSEAGMRTLAKAGDWYDRRQPVHFAIAIVLPLALAAIAVVFAGTKGKTFLSRRPAALFGWILLVLYLVLRQSQEWKPAQAVLEAIHYPDWRVALEVAGIVLVVGSAVMSRQSSPSS